MIHTLDNLPVRETINSRHSIRKFKQEEVSKEQLNELFELVRLSPSAWNLQPWRFHVITDDTMQKELQDAAYGQQQITSAPAVIVVASDMEDVVAHIADTVHPGLSPERKQEEIENLTGIFNNMSEDERGQWGLNQTNIALGILLVAARGLGLSTVPMLGFDQDKVKQMLKLPTHVKFAGMVPIGFADEDGYPHYRHGLEKIVTFH
ncbi:nitroreductase family protein [Bacillus alkalicellulosilyticus]|uniref:nitroreductase family protein n=1 Tax=Alkalihalobacterium alkalicellulosilyticum TaxID=1912214 RepID=UPI000996EAD8|nr:nitroreductase family protein [Bacillus alkalicellulosilyticus]